MVRTSKDMAVDDDYDQPSMASLVNSSLEMLPDDTKITMDAILDTLPVTEKGIRKLHKKG